MVTEPRKGSGYSHGGNRGRLSRRSNTWMDFKDKENLINESKGGRWKDTVNTQLQLEVTSNIREKLF